LPNDHAKRCQRLPPSAFTMCLVGSVVASREISDI
jgi:hypothetical protein